MKRGTITTAMSAALAVAGLAGFAPTAFAGTGVVGQQAPSSYSPSDASLTSTPTYATSRANTDGTVTNGQDFDHYCQANWQSQSILAGSTSGDTTRVPMQVSKNSTNPALAGDNGLLYANQWWNSSQTNPFYRIPWATDFPVHNAKLVIQLGSNWSGGTVANGKFTPYSSDPTTLLSQIQIWSGASKFRTYDWSTYVLGQQNKAPWAGATSYVPGAYTGVNTDMFSLNPNVQTTTAPAPYTDPYYPQPDQYVPNTSASDPNSFAHRISYDATAKTITVDLGDQPAGAMIVFGVQGQSDAVTNGTLPADATSESYGLTANFTGSYTGTDPRNTVCYPVSVNWHKTDAVTGKALAGSSWAVRPTSATAPLTSPVTVSDDSTGASTAVGTDTDTSAGNLGASTASTTQVLQPGTWSIQESGAPKGYSLASTQLPVTLDFNHQSVDAGTVSDVDNAPVITAPATSVPMGSKVDLRQGVSATDVEDGDLTKSVVVSNDGGFNPNKPGTYTITYSVTDAGGKTSTVTRVITVTAVAPVITAPAVSVVQGTSFNPLTGVTAHDVVDGDLTSKVVVVSTGGFDPNKPGSYTITYRVTDSSGVTSTTTRVVTVTARVMSYSRTFQVDQYNPVVAGNAKATAANKAMLTKLVANGTLARGADFGTGCYQTKNSPTCMWNRTKHTIITVTASGTSVTAPSDAQWLAALNAQVGSSLGRLTTTSRTAVTGQTTVAWTVQTAKGATASAPFGGKLNLAQTFFARS